MSEWISTSVSLPEYGQPVLVVSGGVVQNVTYMLDGADDVPDWFEPYHFEHDNELKVWWHSISAWMYLPEPPNA